MKRLASLILAMFVLSACVHAATPTSAPATGTALLPTNIPSPTPAIANLSQSSISELVALITSEKASLAEALQATQEILARGGVAIGDMQNTFVRPYVPASSLVLTPREVLQLAEEARSGPSVWRMDLAELGQMLSELGWPTDPDGITVGEQLATLLFAWSAEAARNPQDAENSTPLFLMAMAKHRAPGVDFSSGVVAPEEIRLGMLEVVLFIAAFDRLIPLQTTSNHSPAHLASLLPAGNGLPAAQISPCKPFQDSLFGRLAYSQVGTSLLQWVAGKGLEKALNAAGISEWGQDRIGKAMFATAMFARVMRALLMAAYVNIRVSIEGDQQVHKPLEGEQLLKAFHAQAGIPTQDWQTYQEQFGRSFHNAMRECLSWLGLSTYTLEDLGEEVDTWAIEWRLEKGSEGHAHWSPGQQIVPGQAHQGYWRTKLIRSGTGDVAGTSTFVVEVRNEKEKDHPGISLEAPVRACAYLDVAQSPSFNTFFQAGAGGLAGAADSVVELLQGMMNKLAKPKDCEDLQVTYHTDCITALWYIQQGAMKPNQEALDRLRKCLTFELKFQSRVDMAGYKGGRYRATAESTIRLQLDPSDLNIKGKGPLNLLSASWEVPGCSTNTTTAPGIFEVFKLEFVFLRRLQTDEVVVQDLRLVYNPGGDDATRAIETSIWSCPEVGTFTIPGPFWLSGYVIPHENEISQAEGGFVATAWDIPGGEEYAKKEWSTTGYAGGAITESGYFVLHHRPEE